MGSIIMTKKVRVILYIVAFAISQLIGGMLSSLVFKEFNVITISITVLLFLTLAQIIDRKKTELDAKKDLNETQMVENKKF